MSKRYSKLPKTLPSFSQMQEKPETCQNLNLINFRRPSLGDEKCNVYIVTTSALYFKQLYTF